MKTNARRMDEEDEGTYAPPEVYHVDNHPPHSQDGSHGCRGSITSTIDQNAGCGSDPGAWKGRAAAAAAAGGGVGGGVDV
jgi:hypothetical protein